MQAGLVTRYKDSKHKELYTNSGTQSLTAPWSTFDKKKCQFGQQSQFMKLLKPVFREG